MPILPFIFTKFEQLTSPAPTHEISRMTSNNLITSTPGPMKSTIRPLHLAGVSEISSNQKLCVSPKICHTQIRKERDDSIII